MDLPRGCPHAANAALLAEGTVAEVVLPDGVPGMAVLGHEALKELIGHPDVAKNARHFTALREERIPDGWPLRTFATVAGMVTSDGEDHRRLRSLTGKALTARRVKALRPRVERLTAGPLDMLRSGEADWADAVEETLRWDSPVSFFPFRYPPRDVTVDGTLIPRGTPVPAGFSAAGRDPAAYGPDADRFDVTRAGRGGRGDRGGRGHFTTRHLSLGHGTHYAWAHHWRGWRRRSR